MNKSPGLLDDLAVKHGVFISDLRIDPQLCRAALRDLSAAEVSADRQREWQEAMAYLKGEEWKAA